MFRRLILEDYTAACLTVAFITAATIFLSFAWRALRMNRTQVDRFAHLPLEREEGLVRPDSTFHHKSN